MLLTGGQISMAISSVVGKFSLCPFDLATCSFYSKVFMFTFLLFLSGYVLQQQTVRSIQAAIKPPTPPPLPSTDSTRVIAKHFGDPNINSLNEKFLVTNKPKGGWAKVAYVQLIRQHLHVCNAAMLFAELEHEESMARKVMLYPKEWHTQQDGMDAAGLKSETSLRILKNAEKRYKVELQPVDRIQASAEGMITIPGFLKTHWLITPEQEMLHIRCRVCCH